VRTSNKELTVPSRFCGQKATVDYHAKLVLHKSSSELSWQTSSAYKQQLTYVAKLVPHTNNSGFPVPSYFCVQQATVNLPFQASSSHKQQLTYHAKLVPHTTSVSQTERTEVTHRLNALI
jgi:hypothetical protein